jgi:ketosteroid isomerase-like protein
MKIRLLLVLVGLAIIFAVPTFAQQTNTPDPQLRQQLERLAKSFEDAWNSNDAAALAALFTEDAVLVNDSGPVNGREAIKKYYTDLFQNVHFSNNVTTYATESPHIVCPNCDEVWENGSWSMTWQVKGGDPVHGKGLPCIGCCSRGRCFEKAVACLERNSGTGCACSDEIDEKRRVAEQLVAS